MQTLTNMNIHIWQLGGFYFKPDDVIQFSRSTTWGAMHCASPWNSPVPWFLWPAASGCAILLRPLQVPLQFCPWPFFPPFFLWLLSPPPLALIPEYLMMPPNPYLQGSSSPGCQTHVANSSRRPSTTPLLPAFTSGFPNRPGLLWRLRW